MQRSYGYSGEDGRLIVNPMAGEGKEPTWSMGDDAPLAVLSERIRPLTAFFRQRFAQVTNPPIDSLREKKVMALDSYIGPRGNLLVERSRGQLVDPPASGWSSRKRTSTNSPRIDKGVLEGAKISTLFQCSTDGAPAGAALTAALDQLIETARMPFGRRSVIWFSPTGASMASQVAIPDGAGGRRASSRANPRADCA